MFNRCGRGGWTCGPACSDHGARALSVPAFKRRPVVLLSVANLTARESAPESGSESWRVLGLYCYSGCQFAGARIMRAIHAAAFAGNTAGALALICKQAREAYSLGALDTASREAIVREYRASGGTRWGELAAALELAAISEASQRRSVAP